MMSRLLQLLSLLNLAAWLLAALLLVLGFPWALWLLVALSWMMGMGFCLQFWAACAYSQRNPVPSVALASPAQMLQAWWGELVALAWTMAWWMPWRSQAEPDYLPERPTGRVGVVLIHGFVCNRGLWQRWFPRLRAGGHAYVALNLEPVWGSIDDYAPLIEEAVQRVTRATGRAPVLICHSMGGLAARAWLRASAARKLAQVRRVERVITLGTPHGGTALAALNPFKFAQNALQMREQSDWLKALQEDESRQASGFSPAGVYGRFVCYYGHCDTVVFPPAHAMLTGADNRHLTATAHLAMALDRQVIDECLGLLQL